MIDKIKTNNIGNKVVLSIKDFKDLVNNYKLLKENCIKLQKSNDYLNNEIQKYNKEFTSKKDTADDTSN